MFEHAARYNEIVRDFLAGGQRGMQRARFVVSAGCDRQRRGGLERQHPSQTLGRVRRPFVAHVAGIDQVGRLDQQHLA